MLLFSIVQALSLLPASDRTASPMTCLGASQMLYNIIQPEVSSSQIHQMRLMYSTKGKAAAADKQASIEAMLHSAQVLWA